MSIVGNESTMAFTQVGWPLPPLDLNAVQLGCGWCLLTLCPHYTVPPDSGTVWSSHSVLCWHFPGAPGCLLSLGLTTMGSGSLRGGMNLWPLLTTGLLMSRKSTKNSGALREQRGGRGCLSTPRVSGPGQSPQNSRLSRKPHLPWSHCPQGGLQSQPW